MATTLLDARSALLKLADQFPAPSIYATQLAVLSDYFDNQVPLLIENKALHQRINVLEVIMQKVRDSLPTDPAIVTVTMPLQSQRGGRTGIECSAWMGPGCKCRACEMVPHA